MLTDADRKCIVETARKYGARKVFLFGSSAAAHTEAQDIDLAVQGIPPSRFFRFYGELIYSLSKPVDLVDLDCDSPFTQMVSEVGVPVYG
jgi:predicted nucleotidyltransferase